MTNKRKGISIVHTKQGRRLRAWINRTTGVILPSNWKDQSAFMGAIPNPTPHYENRHNRFIRRPV